MFPREQGSRALSKPFPSRNASLEVKIGNFNAQIQFRRTSGSAPALLHAIHWPSIIIAGLKPGLPQQGNIDVWIPKPRPAPHLVVCNSQPAQVKVDHKLIWTRSSPVSITIAYRSCYCIMCLCDHHVFENRRWPVCALRLTTISAVSTNAIQADDHDCSAPLSFNGRASGSVQVVWNTALPTKRLAQLSGTRCSEHVFGPAVTNAEALYLETSTKAT